MIPTYVLEGMLAVYAYGCVNMFNLEAVAWRLRSLNHLAASAWLETNRERYEDVLAEMGKRIAKGDEG